MVYSRGVLRDKKQEGYNVNKIKIYFVASNSGGSDDAPLHMHIIEELSQYGIVLTEYVGDVPFGPPGAGVENDVHIYHRNLLWIAAADLLVAEVTTPSLGVGYEIAKAEQHGKMILCLYRPAPDRKLSAMIAGNAYVQIEHYKSRSDLAELFKGYFLE